MFKVVVIKRGNFEVFCVCIEILEFEFCVFCLNILFIFYVVYYGVFRDIYESNF